MTRFSVESIQVIRDSLDLVRDHWDEIVEDSRVLDPHWDLFDGLERIGALRVFVARDDAGVVGYAVFILQPHLHCKGLLSAHNDAVFMRKDKRSSGDGYRLLKYCDDELSAAGVGMIFWHVKPRRDFGSALERMGYRMHEKIYTRIIEGA
jgi:GNAT superfamily N-acetyltransferase